MSKLILIPTRFEFDFVADKLAKLPAEICGFGVAAAAARTAQLIERLRPQNIILIGIAGRISQSLEIGSAYEFDEVVNYGIGAGTGATFQPAGEMGWHHWASADKQIGDVIPLAKASSLSAGAATVEDVKNSADASAKYQLLTGCSASQDSTCVQHRQQAFPNACAEDMEGFGVALACRMADVSCRIIRGISNTCGDRNTAGWRIESALTAAVALATAEH